MSTAVPAFAACGACKDRAQGSYQDAQPTLPSTWQPVRATLRAKFEGFLLLRCTACERHWRIAHDRREGFWEIVEYPADGVARLASNRWETAGRAWVSFVEEVHLDEPAATWSLADVVALLGYMAAGALLGCVGHYFAVSSSKLYLDDVTVSEYVVVGIVLGALIWRSGRTKRA